MSQKPKPTLDVIRLAHQGHLKWWRGQPMDKPEHDAMVACQGFDLVAILLELVDKVASGAI